VHNRYILMPLAERDIYLTYLCNTVLAINRTMFIFTQMVCETRRVSSLLGLLGIGAVSLHAGLSPSARTAALNEFRAGVSPVIVTTDTAARLGPLPRADYVVHFQLTWRMNAETYMQRIRNVACTDKAGHAITFVSQ
ncbi:P-loop containing nucleoside triphosphate hydrolase protein, partial [Achaetomium macrosporum]